jgi:Raf kinase inhibitor-like YbhB/YbcL family protein
MRAIKILTGVTLFVGLIAYSSHSSPSAVPAMTITSSAFEDNGIIPAKYTRSVDKPISPSVAWTNAPQETISFALIFHDPDSPVQKSSEDTLHWLAFNIPGTARKLDEAVPANAQLPDGTIQGKTNSGVGYKGPGAAANGPLHHYIVELYALDSKLDLGPDATRADLLKAMDGHVLAKGVIVGRFHR